MQQWRWDCFTAINVDVIERIKKLDSSSKDHKELTKSVAICLAKDMLPIYTVKKEGFKAMLRKFNPRYDLPSIEIISVELRFPPSTRRLTRNWKHCLQETKLNIFLLQQTCGHLMQWSHTFIHYINKRTWRLHSACL